MVLFKKKLIGLLVLEFSSPMFAIGAVFSSPWWKHAKKASRSALPSILSRRLIPNVKENIRRVKKSCAKTKNRRKLMMCFFCVVFAHDFLMRRMLVRGGPQARWLHRHCMLVVNNFFFKLSTSLTLRAFFLFKASQRTLHERFKSFVIRFVNPSCNVRWETLEA